MHYLEPMHVYPENALSQLEFDKITTILLNYCQTNMGVEQVNEMRIHTHQKYIEEALRQTEEFKFIKLANQYFPTDFILDKSSEALSFTEPLSSIIKSIHSIMAFS